MGRPATRIDLTTEDRQTLEQWLRASTTQQRLVLRANIILDSASGVSTEEIARARRTRPATVSKWRKRFSQLGLVGLQDETRPGKPAQYGKDDARRILALLDQSPPPGYAQWNGKLVAEKLKDVSKDFVWQVLRTHGIQLQRRRSWCISTDPQFAPKAADIVGIYLNPPINAVVLCVDEKPSIQALERAQGYLRFADGRAITGMSHEYKRHGTSTLFAALNVLSGHVSAEHYRRRRRVEFLDFMNQVVHTYPNQEIHVVLDNLNTHKPKHDAWLARNKQVHFHFTPTHASWLNQIECWFSIMTRNALRNASFHSVPDLRTAIDNFIKSYNRNAEPFEWRKSYVEQKKFTNYAHLLN